MSEQTSDNQALTTFNANAIDEFCGNGGEVGGQFAGADLLLLTTLGAKSRQPRINPASISAHRWQDHRHRCLRRRQRRPGVGAQSAGQSARHNELGTQSFGVIAHELSSDERKSAWSEMINAEPGFTEYQSQNSRVFPVFEFRPV